MSSSPPTKRKKYKESSSKNDIPPSKQKPNRTSKSLDLETIDTDSEKSPTEKRYDRTKSQVINHRKFSISEIRPNLKKPQKETRIIMTMEEEDGLIKDIREKKRQRNRSNTFVGLNSRVKLNGMMREDDVKVAPRSRSGFCSPFWKEGDEVVVRKSLRFNVGYAESVGKRSTMEDKMFVLGQVKYDQGIDAFGLFDGHGGGEVSEYANGAFPLLLDQRVKRSKPNPKHTLKNVVRDINEGIRANDLKGGTTCIVAYIRDENCYVCNLGDSRAVYCDQGQATRVSQDHTPANPEERERILENGGTVKEHVTRDGIHVQRINGQLSLSRCLGDFPFSDWISDKPDIIDFEFTDPENFLIIACDGLWDVVSDQEAVDISTQFLENDLLEEAASRLRDIAYYRGSTDNISIMIIKPISNTQYEKLQKKSKGNCTIS